MGIRTPGQSVKSRLLYLAELQAHKKTTSQMHCEQWEKKESINLFPRPFLPLFHQLWKDTSHPHGL